LLVLIDLKNKSILNKSFDSLRLGENLSIMRSRRVTSTSETSITFNMHRDGYDPLSFFTTSSPTYSLLQYKFLQKYNAIIEPSVDMIIYAPSLTESTFTLTLCPYDSSTKVMDEDCDVQTLSITSRASFSKSCAPYDEFYITIEGLSGNSVTTQITGVAICLYVRRDMTTLTEKDLSTTMDAMYTLWSVEEEEGQKLYGANFHSIDYFAEAHMFNAAQRDADHIHEGLGFLPQHIKITNLYELALQAVNPTVSLPYWDYTYETGDFSESIMFSEKTFGSLNFPSTNNYWSYSHDSLIDAAIQDGRWAMIQTKENSKYPDLINGYGYMRGPWNTNPSPYISRFIVNDASSTLYLSAPSCSSFYGMLEESTLMNFLSKAPFFPHASIHGGIGGMFGCDILDSMLSAGLVNSEQDKLQICKKWTTVSKELYRSNFISVKEGCSMEDKSLGRYDFSCGYTCNPDKSDAIFIQSLKGYIQDYVPTNMNTDQWTSWIDFICDGEAYKMFSGDHFESTSPEDPSFWPIHGNLERLFHAKLMTGGFSNNAWGVFPSDICDKSTCYDADEDEKGEYSHCCYGHYENDQLLDFVKGDVNTGMGLGNREQLDQTDPLSDSYAMTYIYDEFGWDHCDESFVELYTTLIEESANYPTAKPSQVESYAPDITLTLNPTEELTCHPTFSPTEEILPDLTFHPTFYPTETLENNDVEIFENNEDVEVFINNEEVEIFENSEDATFEKTNAPSKSPSDSSPVKYTHVPTVGSIFTQVPTLIPTRITAPPSKSPITTSSPTKVPTLDPTSLYTHAPTKNPSTQAPSNQPTRASVANTKTNAPSNIPTSKVITSSPTSKPIVDRTKTTAPSNIPTSKVITSSPTSKPIVDRTKTTAPSNIPTSKEIMSSTSKPITDREKTYAPSQINKLVKA